MRWPIRYQLWVPFALTMLCTLIAVSALNAYLAARRSVRQIEAQLEGVASTLLESNFPLTGAVLRQMHGLSGAEFIVTDTAGDVLASSKPSIIHLDQLGTTDADVHEIESAEPMQLDGQRYFHVTLQSRTRAAAQPVLLHILYPEAAWRASRWDAAYPSLLVGGVALVVVTVLASLIAFRFSRPILQLRNHMNRLAAGEFLPLPVPTRNDELRELVLAVNDLAGQLQGMRQAIARGERLALLGQLSSGLAHTLRNDVTGARMAVQLHQRQCPAGNEESLKVALRQLSMTEEHLKRFLAAGQPQPPNFVPCRLGDVIREVAELFAPVLKHRRITLDLDVPPDDPAVRVDPEQLRHLLVNLLVNAAESAGPHGRVEIDLQRSSDEETLVQVRDSGAGPSAEMVDHLFEPFATDKPEGVGLGLPVSRQIAAAHGGTLEYVRLENMTCFQLRLPATIRAGDDEAARSAVPAVAKSQ